LTLVAVQFEVGGGGQGQAVRMEEDERGLGLFISASWVCIGSDHGVAVTIITLSMSAWVHLIMHLCWVPHHLISLSLVIILS
jgi:hypothetical protein